MESFFKAQGLKGAALRTQLTKLFGEDGAPQQHQAFDDMEPLLEADLAQARGRRREKVSA